MPKKQLLLLCVCNAAVYFIGSGLLSLLPVYLKGLGADSTSTGFFLAMAFFSLAVSFIIGGRLSDRLQRRKELLIGAGVLAAPTVFLMGQATTVLQLTVLTGILWFLGGIVSTMISILGGLFSEAGERGRTFGTLGISITISLVLSGLVSGQIVDRWGYPALFGLCSLLYLVVPVVGALLQDKRIARPQKGAQAVTARDIITNRTFIFIFFASILVHIASSEIILSRPLLMNSLNFEAKAISGAPGLGALLTMPLPFIIGWLSDRVGRKPFMIAIYLCTGLGLILIANASEFLHFGVASGLQSCIGVSVILGSALITDLSPKEVLGTSLSLFASTPWIGFTVGFGLGGAAMSAFQITPTLMIGVFLVAVAVLLLIPISTRTPPAALDVPAPSYGEVS